MSVLEKAKKKRKYHEERRRQNQILGGQYKAITNANNQIELINAGSTVSDFDNDFVWDNSYVATANENAKKRTQTGIDIGARISDYVDDSNYLSTRISEYYDSGYSAKGKGDYIRKLHSDLRAEAKEIYNQIENNKQEFVSKYGEDYYNSVVTGLKKEISDIKKRNKSVGKYSDYLNLFDDEESYNTAQNNRKWAQKYGTNMSFDEVQTHISNLENDKAAMLHDVDWNSEKKWLENYVLNYGYKDEKFYKKYLAWCENTISSLKEEGSYDGTDGTYYPGSINPYFKYVEQSDIDKLEEIKSQLESKRELYKRSTLYDKNYKKYEIKKDYLQKVNIGKNISYEDGNRFDIDEKAYQEYRDKYGDDEWSDWGLPDYVDAYEYYYDVHFDLLEENEKNTYYYLLATDKDKAEEYLGDMKPILNVRATELRQKQIKESYEKASDFEKFVMNLNTIAYKPKGYVDSAIGNLIGLFDENGVDPYDNLHAVSNDVNYTREITSEDIESAFKDENGETSTVGKFVSTAYQSGMSLVDMLVLTGIGAVTGGVSAVTSVAFGLDSANSYIKSAYDRGLSKPEMYIGAVLTGLAEGFFEKFSLDKIIKMKPGNLIQLIFNALKSAGIEASEEIATEFASIVIDNAIANTNSENNLEKLRLMNEEGLTREEAEHKVFIDNCSSVIWSGVGGLLSGLVFGAGTNTVQYINNKIALDSDRAKEVGNNILKQNKQYEIINKAKELGIDTKKAENALNNLNETASVTEHSPNETNEQAYNEAFDSASREIAELELYIQQAQQSEGGALVSNDADIEAEIANAQFNNEFQKELDGIELENELETELKDFGTNNTERAVNYLNRSIEKREIGEKVKKLTALPNEQGEMVSKAPDAIGILPSEYTKEEKAIESFYKNQGISTVIFDSKSNVDGFKQGDTVYLNRNTAKEYVFKHEFSHTQEAKQGFNDFGKHIEKAIINSKRLSAWVDNKAKSIKGYNKNATLEDKIAFIKNHYNEQRGGTLSNTEQDFEFYADFVMDNLYNGTDIESTVAEMERAFADKNVWQKFCDFMRRLLKNIKNLGIYDGAKITKLENEFAKVVRSEKTVANDNKTVYNKSTETNRKVDSNVRTNEFRDLQKRSRELSDKDIEGFHRGSKECDESLQRRLSGVFRREINNTISLHRNAYESVVNIKSGKVIKFYKNIDANLFHDVFEIVQKFLYSGDAVDLHSVQDYKNTKNYLSEDGLSGFSITKDGDLISVFNLGQKGFLKSIKDFVKQEGAKTLDCFNSKKQDLPTIYSKTLGFKTASILEFNYEMLVEDKGQEYADYFVETYGKAPVAFMVNTDEEVQAKHFNKDQYMQAVEYRDSFLKADLNESAFSISEKTDADYLKAVEDGDMETAQKMVDKVAKEAGYSVKAYHGTPNGDFTIFRNWQYFTKSKEYADVYQNQGASSNGYKLTANNPKTYSVYLKQDKIFDTRNEKEKRIFENEFYRQWGNGAPLSEKGLPDWTDGDDFVEFFEENDYDYDAILLDEGATGGFGDEVKSRGISIVVKNSNQIKSADPVTYDDDGNVIPLSERFDEAEDDIRFSISDDVDITKNDIENNIKEVANMDSVSDLDGTEFAKSEVDLVTQVDNYFKTFNEQVENSVLGTVDITTRGIKDSIAHGLGRNKAIAFKAVPFVIEKGLIIDYQPNWKNRGYDTFVLGAPITIKGENYYEAVVVIREKQNQRFYVHEVITEKRTELSFKTGTTKSGVPGDNSSPSIFSLLEKIKNVNPKLSVSDDFDGLVDKYGAIDKGFNPQRDIAVPKRTSKKKVTSETVRTFLESGTTTDDMVEIFKEHVVSEDFSHVVFGDEQAMEYAYKTMGFKNTDGKLAWEVSKENLFNDAVKLGNAETIFNDAYSNNKADKNIIALGGTLFAFYNQTGDYKKAIDISGKIIEIGTRSAQIVQAMSLIKKVGSMGQLSYLQKVVVKLNEDLQKKFGKRYGTKKIPEVVLETSLAERLVNAKTEEETQKAVEQIMKSVGKQMSSTFLDKWNAWRYLSMLGNPRTHIRNLVGNAIFMPAISIKNGLATAMEHIFIRDVNNRTTAFKVSEELKEFAKKDFEEMKDFVSSGGKYQDGSQIQKYTQVFKSKLLKPIESARRFNFNALEWEDGIFLKHHYKMAFARFITARKLDVNNLTAEQLSEARKNATLEAQKATYRDASVVAEWINKGTKIKGLGMIIDGILPFKKTPINILKRGVEYSPLGIIQTVGRALIQLRKGKYSGTQFIDGFASVLSGTGFLLLGYWLASVGIAVGGMGNDEDEWFRKQNGEQEFSITLWGKSYTVDWAAPACIPFFIGVELQNILSGENENWGTAFFNSLEASLEPITQLSMLQGLNDTLDTIKWSDSPLTSIISDSITSYFTQALPTLAGQITRVADGTRRKNYVDKNSAVPEWLQKVANTVSSKTGNWGKNPYRNAWGETEVDESIVSRIGSNFLSPGYYSSVDYDAVNTEIKRLYNAEGNKSVLPDTVDNRISVNGEYKYLTADEYEKYQIETGQNAYKYIDEVINSAFYKKADDNTKVDMIADVYSYCENLAKTTVSDYALSSTDLKTKLYLERGVSMADYLKAEYSQQAEKSEFIKTNIDAVNELLDEIEGNYSGATDKMSMVDMAVKFIRDKQKGSLSNQKRIIAEASEGGYDTGSLFATIKDYDSDASKADRMKTIRESSASEEEKYIMLAYTYMAERSLDLDGDGKKETKFTKLSAAEQLKYITANENSIRAGIASDY